MYYHNWGLSPPNPRKMVPPPPKGAPAADQKDGTWHGELSGTSFLLSIKLTANRIGPGATRRGVAPTPRSGGEISPFETLVKSGIIQKELSKKISHGPELDHLQGPAFLAGFRGLAKHLDHHVPVAFDDSFRVA